MEYRYDEKKAGGLTDAGERGERVGGFVGRFVGFGLVKVGLSGRLAALVVAFFLLVPIFVIWAGSEGYVDLKYIFTPCGFKQRTGLPCPGCGVTTAIMALVKGDISGAFYIQPAGAVFGIAGVIAGVFALLVAVFGVNSSVLIKVKFSTFLKYGVVLILFVLACGWAVTLSRALNGG